MNIDTNFIRVIPFVKNIIIEKNGRSEVIKTSVLTEEEMKNISAGLRMYHVSENGKYLAETPPIYRHHINEIAGMLYYIYDELSEEEQKRFFDRSMLLPITDQAIRKFGEDKSKCFFSKKRAKK